MNRFIFTCGDINGIGPEITIKTLNKISKKTKNKFYFICPRNVFLKTAQIIPPEFEYSFIKKWKAVPDSTVTIIDTGNFKYSPGIPTEESGRAAYISISESFHLLNEKKADAVITAPISKTAIKMAGINFPGHTEMFAEWCSVKNFVMMFLSKQFNAALVTIHNPLADVKKLLKKSLIEKKIKVILDSLEKDLNIKDPAVAVLGLNPHAGESGNIGNEENKIIIPALKTFNGSAEGPFSPDAFFAKRYFEKYDLTLGMYHDQILIPFKLLTFQSGVNFTAGLPVVRTSPDHGTAFNIAGKNKANEASLIQAYKYAERIIKNRNRG